VDELDEPAMPGPILGERVKRKKSRLTPEFWCREAEQRVEAERILERLRQRGIVKSAPPPPR